MTLSSMRKCWYYLFVLASLAFLAPVDAHACIVRFRSAEVLKREAELVVLAKVIAKEITGQSQIGELYTYKIEVYVVERGRFSPGVTNVTYYNVRAREVESVMECPLKDGAGIEVGLKVQEDYRFYLNSIDNKEILYSEEITRSI